MFGIDCSNSVEPPSSQHQEAQNARCPQEGDEDKPLNVIIYCVFKRLEVIFQRLFGALYKFCILLLLLLLLLLV